jgi:hypothetical protein
MSSMLYTMGMALDRAAENGFAVRLLVEGAWLEGHVAANDGTERVSAVQVSAGSPYRAPLDRGSSRAGGYDPEDDLVRPMPGPRATMPV